MITLSHLTFSYPGRPAVLRDISVHIAAGSHVAVMGANGSGKSTLALIVKGLQLPESGAITVDGFNPSTDGQAHFEVMRRVGIVFQNPDNTIVSTTVERELAFGLENLGVPEREMRERVEDALVLFDLARHCHTDPGRLSGGERQRLALAGVMIMRPAHLVLDEPTSLLDPEGGERILRLIHDAANRGATVLHITQFAAEALTADRLIVLGEGEVVRDGAPREVLRDTAPLGIESLDDVRTLCYSAAARIPDIPAMASPPLVFLDRISLTYDRGAPFAHQALEGVSLSLPKGSATVLLGPSGSGKTTLLEIAAGIAPPTGGSVVLDGDPLRAMAFQFPEDEIFGETVAEYVAFGPRNAGFSEAEIRRAVDDSLSAVGLEPDRYCGRDPLTLSGGEKRRAALAGVLAMRPEVLVLDEPTAGLDRRGVERIGDILREYGENGGTLLFSTHDFRVARRLAGYTLVLDRGRAETVGELADVMCASPWLCMLRKCRESRLEECGT